MEACTQFGHETEGLQDSTNPAPQLILVCFGKLALSVHPLEMLCVCVCGCVSTLPAAAGSALGRQGSADRSTSPGVRVPTSGRLCSGQRANTALGKAYLPIC